MGRIQKKNAKGRLDRYYYLAKEKGYRARSSFKLLQINEKYGHFLEKSKVVVDLCAAPGSWCQVASELCPVNSLIVGVDIVQMRSLPKCITFQSDITTDDCRSKLRGYLKTWKADTVLHDGAPNVGLNWIQDAYGQSRLTLEALRLAVEHLTPGGTFVTKVFRSRDYNNLIWVFKQLFDHVEATKPPASRNVSAEIFVVCKRFKAPKKMDPKFLDPKAVFEELPEGPQNNEAKVYNPEMKKRKRVGYDENDWTHFHALKLMDWVHQEEDVVNTLGSVSAFEIEKINPEWKIVKKMKQTTPEFLECCKDLQVLGKKDFKYLIKWRKHARETLGLLEKKDKVLDKSKVELEDLTEDQRIDKELRELSEKEKKEQKRKRRAKNEMRQKEVRRMQMDMLSDMQIGIDAAENGSESMFSLKMAKKTGILKDLAKGKKAMIIEDKDDDMSGNRTGKIIIDPEQEEGNLEKQLDDMYTSYKERKMETDDKLRAKLTRGDEHEEKWEGFTENASDSSDDAIMTDGEASSSDSDDDEAINKLVASMKERKDSKGLSSSAKNFYKDPIFQDLDLNVAPTSGSSKRKQTKELKVSVGGSAVDNEDEDNQVTNSFKDNLEVDSASSSDDDEDEDGRKKSGNSDFEVVPNDYHSKFDDSEEEYETDSDEERKTLKNKEEIDISTVSAMTMAQDLALGKKSKHDIISETYNKYSFRDREGLPAWFIEDEEKHSKINRPVTKEAVMALKEKMRLLNARPIKKVMEARARKKIRAAKRMEQIKKKSELILEDSARSESDKAKEIQGMMRKMTKKQERPKPTLVVARGANRGLKGRPKGIRGKYKMVDGVMKNEMRALKRIAKKNKKHRKH